MAPQAMPQPPAPDSSTLAQGRIRNLSIAVVVIGAFNKASLNNVMASAAMAIAAPAAATAFVYEVSTLRNAQLQHEATDRGEFLRISAEPAPALAEGEKSSSGAVQAPSHPDISNKLDGMIASRTKMLDLFGDDPSTVAPIYVRIIKQMLNDDNATLASLPERSNDRDAEALAAKEANLRAVHARLEHLVGT
jgi:hypothetical protein